MDGVYFPVPERGPVAGGWNRFILVAVNEFGEHLFSADWAGNVGYGFWQHATLTTFT